MPRSPALLLLAALGLASPAAAQEDVPSICHAVAEALPKATFVSLRGDASARFAQAKGERSASPSSTTRPTASRARTA